MNQYFKGKSLTWFFFNLFFLLFSLNIFFVPLGFSSETIECDQPIEVVSYKIGVCKVSEKGKTCSTTFKLLGYHAPTNTSVVLCLPHSGRMHQIRVHLQFLGLYRLFLMKFHLFYALVPCGSTYHFTHRVATIVEKTIKKILNLKKTTLLKKAKVFVLGNPFRLSLSKIYER